MIQTELTKKPPKFPQVFGGFFVFALAKPTILGYPLRCLKEVMPVPRIYEEGNVDAHILYGDEFPQVHCFDKRHGFMEVEVTISLHTGLVDGYGEDLLELPTPEFVIEALQSVLKNYPLLRQAWLALKDEF